MNEVLIYILETGICITIFTIFYALVLRKETFFRLNRFFLMFSLLFVIVVPLLTISYDTGGTSSASPGYGILNVLQNIRTVRPDFIQLDAIVIESGKFHWNVTLMHVLFYTYLLGVLFHLLHMSLKFIQLFRKISFSEKQSDGRFYYVKSGKNEKQVYSFFHYIFVGKESLSFQENKQVIEHEKTHALRYHSLDLILTELIIVLQWFNPFIYLFRKMVVENHEFEADKVVLKRSANKENYLRLILDQVIDHHYFRMTSGFSYSLTKKRLKMLTRKKLSHNTSFIKILAVIPLIFMLFFAFACDGEEKEIKEDPVKKEMEKEGPVKIDDVYLKADKMPVYNDDEYLVDFRDDIQKNLTYPREAAKKNIEGTVYVTFIIDEEGNLTNKKVLRGAHPLLDKAALKGFEDLPGWKPGEVDGKPVKIKFTIPIVFKL